MVDQKIPQPRNKKQEAPKKGNSAVTYNVRVKPKGPQGVMSAPYKIEKRTVKTSRGR